MVLEESPLFFAPEGHVFIPKPKLVFCEICSGIATGAFICDYNIERLFTEKEK